MHRKINLPIALFFVSFVAFQPIQAKAVSVSSWAWEFFKIAAITPPAYHIYKQCWTCLYFTGMMTEAFTRAEKQEEAVYQKRLSREKDKASLLCPSPSSLVSEFSERIKLEE